MSIWSRLFGSRRPRVGDASKASGSLQLVNTNEVLIDPAAKLRFLKRIEELNICIEGLLKSTYGYTGRYKNGAAGQILEHHTGSSSKLWTWVEDTLKKDGSSEEFSVIMSNNIINQHEDRGGRIGLSGAFTNEAHIWVVRIGRDRYEWILWKFDDPYE